MSWLEKILENKKLEILKIPEIKISESDLLNRDQDFLKNIQAKDFSVIGEIKSKSPSEGQIIPMTDFDPVKIALNYEQAGMQAVSVLTDSLFFGGSYEILKNIADKISLPVLCKEFILDAKQIIWARKHGAHACLLIVRILPEEKLLEFINLCESLGMTALVEVFTEAECKMAVRAGAKLIGINNRDLNSLEMDKNRAEKLKIFIPENIPVIALSGVKSALEIPDLRKNFEGVLIGTALMRLKDLKDLKEFMGKLEK